MKNKELIEKYYRYGISGMNDSEILQLILSFSSVRDAEKLSDELINEFGNLNSIFNADINYLTRNNISDKTACLLKAFPAVSMECLFNRGQRSFIKTPDDLNCYFRALYSGVSDERIYLVSVNRHKMVKGEHLIATGSSDSVNFSKEKIIRCILGLKAYGVFISHNHPESEAYPSEADFEFTRSIVDSVRNCGTKIFDHIIVGVSSVVSMKELNCGIDFD